MDKVVLTYASQAYQDACDWVEENAPLGVKWIICNALKKQIPKKPNIEIWDLSSDDDNDVYCPTCGMLIGSTQEMEDNNFYTPHCYYCGQAILWE